MKHLLGPFVPPPLLLVLVSSLRLLLLAHNSKGGSWFHPSSRPTNFSSGKSSTNLFIRIVVRLLLILVAEQIQLNQLADVGGLLRGELHGRRLQLLQCIGGSLRLLGLLLLVQSSHLGTGKAECRR